MAEGSQQNKQQRRDRERRQARARRRRSATAVFAVLAVVVFVAVVLIWRGGGNDPTSPKPSETGPAPTQSQTAPSTQPTQTVPSTRPAEPEPSETRIQLVFGGDLVADETVFAAGEMSGHYDFSSVFMDIAPVFAAANGAALNYEGVLTGSPAHKSLLQAVSNAGVDFVQMANSYTVSQGILGLEATLQDIRDAGMIPVGAYGDEQQAQQEQGFTLCNIGGLKVALVGYTKGFDGLRLPEGNEWCVNLLYTDYASTYQQVAEDAIKQTLKNIQDQAPDLTVAMLHWGSAYNDIISASQKKLEALMLENGVDVIIGTHSHYVQQIKYDPAAGTVVAYSLGDLFSGGEKSGSQYSVLLQLEVTRDNVTGHTDITGCDYVPIYTLTPERDGEAVRVVRIEQAMAMYENSHIHRVNATAYQNLKSALERIRSRVGF